jgi:hypothetical protein
MSISPRDSIRHLRLARALAGTELDGLALIEIGCISKLASHYAEDGYGDNGSGPELMSSRMPSPAMPSSPPSVAPPSLRPPRTSSPRSSCLSSKRPMNRDHSGGPQPVLGAVESAVQIVSGADQRQMRQRLRKVAQKLAANADLLGVQLHVIA